MKVNYSLHGNLNEIESTYIKKCIICQCCINIKLIIYYNYEILYLARTNNFRNIIFLKQGGVVGYGLGCAGVEESGGGGECEFAEVYFVVEGCV